MYSQRYAAPEILATSLGLVTDRRAGIQPDVDCSGKEVEDIGPHALANLNSFDDGKNGHGRKTDILSLGCVFLELLACLCDERLPMDRKDASDGGDSPNGAMKLPGDVQVFSYHIPDLKAWAEDVNRMAELSPLLQLAVRMISASPRERPTISEVISDVAAAGSQFL